MVNFTKHPSFVRLAFAFCATSTTLLAGCSGGGGGTPSGTPTVAPSGVPTATASPGGTNATTFTIQSVPAGLGVTITSGTGTQKATPTTEQPPSSDKATTISIAPSDGASPFAYVADQRGNGSHTVLYNQSADTRGSIASIGASSAARRAAKRAVRFAGVPRFFSHGARGKPSESRTRLVVRYKAAALQSMARGVRDLEAGLGIARGVAVGFEREGLVTRVVDVPAGQSIATLAARLRARPEVADARPERLYYKESTTPFSPNDTHFDNYQQWALFDIKALNAWGYTKGSTGISIAVIDTGADFNHQDLAGSKIVYGESVLNGVVTTGSAAAQDTDGHGTNVAGIAAAVTDNGFGFAGVGFNTSLQIYKVFADGKAPDYTSTANSSDVTQAIYDAVTHGARVINLSLGTCQSEGVDTEQRDAVSYAVAHNVVIVAAAGNERGSGTSTDSSCSTNSTTVDFPAAYDGAIAVGASALNDTAAPTDFDSATEYVASYSNSGPGLALVAPGGDPPDSESAPDSTVSIDALHWIYQIFTTTTANPAASAQCSDKADCKALFAGTSQATPHVSGAAGLMLGLNPNLTASQVKQILMSTADDINDPNQGAGRLDTYRALAAVAGDPNPPALPTSRNFVAFAYAPSGGNTPSILDVTYPAGVPVASDGTFRIADIPQSAPAYKIGVWSDVNGDGKIDAGDAFGSSQLCSAAAACASAAGIVVTTITGSFVLN